MRCKDIQEKRNDHVRTAKLTHPTQADAKAVVDRFNDLFDEDYTAVPVGDLWQVVPVIPK